MSAPVSASFQAMGSTAHVVVFVDQPERATDLMRVATSTIARLEQRWSRFLRGSDINRINANPGVPVQVHPTTVALVGRAVDAWSQTGGVFNPTVGASLIAAGYDRSFAELAPLTSASACPASSPADVAVHPIAETVTVPTGVTLDLGGIGKGAAADHTVRVLLAAGAKAAMVNLGGDLRAEGDGPEDGWNVVLDCPGSLETRSIRISAGAVCTSSTIKRRWKTIDGERHHIIEPASGESTESDICTATVVGAEAAQCEVLATTTVAMGRARGSELLNRHHASGLLVDHGGQVHDVGDVGAFR